MKTFTPHTWEVRDSIGILTLNNPPGNFLLSPEFIPLETLEGYLASHPLKGIVICGAGKHFSGGADLEQLYAHARDPQELAILLDKGKRLLERIDTLDIPVAAAMKGLCFGGGLEIALACDIRYCSANALFAFPESNHGLMPGLSGTVRLTGLAGLSDSLEMILGGDMLNAEEALEMKLVDKVLYDEDPTEAAFRFLRKITDGRELPVIRSIMTALHNALLMDPADAIREETRMFCELANGRNLKI